MSDFDFDESPTRALPSLQKPNFNPIQESSVQAPKQTRSSAPGNIQRKTVQDRPKKAKLPAAIAACDDCAELRLAYKQLLEQEKEMKKVLRDKQLEIKKQADLLVKTDQKPDNKSKQAKEQIRILESQIEQTKNRIDAIKIGDPEKEKMVYQSKKDKEKPYLQFLENTNLLKQICEKIEIERRVEQKRQHLSMLEEKLLNKGKGKFQINKVEIMNIKRSLIASREQILNLKDTREKNYAEIIELQTKLQVEYKVDLEELFQGQTYEFRGLDLLTEKTENQPSMQLIQPKRAPSPPAPPLLMEHEIPAVEPVIEIMEPVVAEPVEAQYPVVEMPQQEPPPTEDDFDDYQSDNEQVEMKLMASIKK